MARRWQVLVLLPALLLLLSPHLVACGAVPEDDDAQCDCEASRFATAADGDVVCGSFASSTPLQFNSTCQALCSGMTTVQEGSCSSQLRSIGTKKPVT